MCSKVWDEITYPFPNFNGTTIEVWEWISNSIPHFMIYVIAYPCSPMHGCITRPSRVDTTKEKNPKQNLQHISCYVHIDGFVLKKCNSSALGMELYLFCIKPGHHQYGLMQRKRNSSSLAMELHLFCSNPSIYCCGPILIAFFSRNKYRYISELHAQLFSRNIYQVFAFTIISLYWNTTCSWKHLFLILTSQTVLMTWGCNSSGISSQSNWPYLPRIIAIAC